MNPNILTARNATNLEKTKLARGNDSSVGDAVIHIPLGRTSGEVFEDADSQEER